MTPRNFVITSNVVTSMASRFASLILAIVSVGFTSPESSRMGGDVGFVAVYGAQREAAYACAVKAPIWVRVTQARGQVVEYELVEHEVQATYEVTPRKPQVGRPLRDLVPFDPGPGFDMEGTWVAERVDDGWLAGLDRGEWGGGLWYIREGMAPQQLVDRNRVYAIGLLDDPYIVVADWDPNADREATSVLKLHKEGSHWRAVSTGRLTGGFVAIDDAGRGEVYLLSYFELARFTGDTFTILTSDLEGIWELGPFSFAADENSVFVGMRMLMLQADRRGGARHRWFIPNRCRETRPVPVTLVGFGHEVAATFCECIASD